MKTKDVLAVVGVTIMAYSAGKFLGKLEALTEVLDKEEINADSLTVKFCKGASLTVFKKHTDKEGA